MFADLHDQHPVSHDLGAVLAVIVHQVNFVQSCQSYIANVTQVHPLHSKSTPLPLSSGFSHLILSPSHCLCVLHATFMCYGLYDNTFGLRSERPFFSQISRNISKPAVRRARNEKVREITWNPRSVCQAFFFPTWRPPWIVLWLKYRVFQKK